MYEYTEKDFKKIRENEAGLSKAAFAEALGVTEDMIARIESGRSLPSTRLLFRMIRKYGIHFELSPDIKHPLLSGEG